MGGRPPQLWLGLMPMAIALSITAPAAMPLSPSLHHRDSLLGEGSSFLSCWVIESS
jgi:hypothetical protein